MFPDLSKLTGVYTPVKRSIDYGKGHMRGLLVHLHNHDVSATFTKARRAAYLGLLSVIVFSVSWITGVVLDGTWAYGINYLSDLGVSPVFGARVAFTVGCISAGIGFVAYGYSVMKTCPRFLVKLTYLLSIVCGICLIGVGTFNEGTLLHYPFALTLGGFAIASILISIGDDLIEHKHESALKTALIFLVFIISLVGTRQFAEATAVIALMTWVFVKCSSFIMHNRI